MFRKTSMRPRPRRKEEFDTSTTTAAPFKASASPSPVTALMPELGDEATTSCPSAPSFVTSFEPMSPLPPTTVIFMSVLISSS